MRRVCARPARRWERTEDLARDGEEGSLPLGTRFTTSAADTAIGHAERALVIHDVAWDANCPQHIPQRLEAEDVKEALAERDRRIAALEAELKALRESAQAPFTRFTRIDPR